LLCQIPGFKGKVGCFYLGATRSVGAVRIRQLVVGLAFRVLTTGLGDDNTTIASLPEKGGEMQQAMRKRHVAIIRSAWMTQTFLWMLCSVWAFKPQSRDTKRA
jgi:hypothetical protein